MTVDYILCTKCSRLKGDLEPRVETSEIKWGHFIWGHTMDGAVFLAKNNNSRMDRWQCSLGLLLEKYEQLDDILEIQEENAEKVRRNISSRFSEWGQKRSIPSVSCRSLIPNNVCTWPKIETRCGNFLTRWGPYFRTNQSTSTTRHLGLFQLGWLPLADDKLNSHSVHSCAPSGTYSV